MRYLMRAAVVALGLVAIGPVTSCTTAGTQQGADHSAPSQQDRFLQGCKTACKTFQIPGVNSVQ
jgi:hypothetical protein